ncbi:MAG TPA: helix-turn-helix domain-containing protein [Solirubrobacter sp.]|nr:helix-turn-helix domain-containing protein [Solirubrobacter sp.]
MDTLARRPLRADARRNRERVLKAAQVAFAERGHDAQMDDVARRAGVGVGTVYRHFPTKEALVEALATDRFERILAAGREALEAPDPWDGFTGALMAGAELTASDRSFSEIVGELTGPMPVPEPLLKELYDVYGELMRRAQTAGQLRSDLVLDDIPMIMCGIGIGARKTHECPQAWRRHAAILIDGLRASGASAPLPS